MGVANGTDAVRFALMALGVVHLQKCYPEWGYAPGSYPVTERVATEILSLPIFPGLTPLAQQRVAALLSERRASTLAPSA